MQNENEYLYQFNEFLHILDFEKLFQKFLYGLLVLVILNNTFLFDRLQSIFLFIFAISLKLNRFFNAVLILNLIYSSVIVKTTSSYFPFL